MHTPLVPPTHPIRSWLRMARAPMVTVSVFAALLPLLFAQAASVTVYELASQQLTVTQQSVITEEINAQGHQLLELTFDYNTESADANDTIEYGWKIGTAGTFTTLGEFKGKNESSATSTVGDEMGTVVVALPPGAQIANLVIEIRDNQAGLTGDDVIELTNIRVRGEVIPIEEEEEEDQDGEEAPGEPEEGEGEAGGEEAEVAQFTVTLSLIGEGVGRIVDVSGEGLSCVSGTTTGCVVDYPTGSNVTLAVEPGVDSNFTDSWRVGAGTCVGTTSPCTITVSSALQLEAHFGRIVSGAPKTQVGSATRVRNRVKKDLIPTISEIVLPLPAPLVLGEQVTMVPEGAPAAGGGGTDRSLGELPHYSTPVLRRVITPDKNNRA